MPGQAKSDGVIAKAALILSAFSPSTPTYSVTELARATGLTPSTAMRRADDLVRAGLLEKDTSRCYSVAPKLQRIAAAAPTGKTLQEIARPVMQDICFATGYDVALIVLQGNEGLIVERLYGNERLKLHFTAGENVPLHCTGGGLALLAHLPTDFRNSILEGPLVAATPYTETDPEKLRRLLAHVRKEGYVMSDRASNLATFAIGAPVFGPGGAVAAGLSVVVDHKHVLKRALIDTARVGARVLSTRLGWKPQPR